MERAAHQMDSDKMYIGVLFLSPLIPSHTHCSPPAFVQVILSPAAKNIRISFCVRKRAFVCPRPQGRNKTASGFEGLFCLRSLFLAFFSAAGDESLFGILDDEEGIPLSLSLVFEQAYKFLRRRTT